MANHGLEGRGGLALANLREFFRSVQHVLVELLVVAHGEDGQVELLQLLEVLLVDVAELNLRGVG